MQANCRICGRNGKGTAFTDWVRPTFTDWDKLQPGEIICDECLFWFNERSEELARLVGKDKPQRIRNYSHFIVGGDWIPLSKGDKSKMKALLLGKSFPELAAVAESGQKHIVFRAPRNPVGNKAGWVQFEEQSVFVHPDQLKGLLMTIEKLYTTFSKTEIGTGQYRQYRIRKFGIIEWDKLESEIVLERGSVLFNLSLFLAQKGENRGRARKSGRTTMVGVARDTSGLQEPLPAHDLGSVRERSEGGGIHEPTGTIHQLDLFASRRNDQDRH